MSLNFFNYDSLSDGQIGSKLWLCDNLEPIVRKNFDEPIEIWIYGAWYGILPFLFLSRNSFPIKKLVLLDLDQNANEVSRHFLNHWFVKGEPWIEIIHFDCNQSTSNG